MQTHFWAALCTTLAVIPTMRRRRQAGRIVNISSIGGKISVPHLVPYSANKLTILNERAAEQNNEIAEAEPAMALTQSSSTETGPSASKTS
jgi:NAD(P)-dependent dehydrogenase (short-subunit alcohol dehydrogenase family)